ncbi:MAG: hypothetical protein Q9163_000378 [Psora crenata]
MDIQLSMSPRRSMAAKSPKELRYRRPHLDNVEDVEKYRKGGFHPIHLGDALKGGRYCVLHKLGHGGFSTVWLAHDKLQDRLVSLKMLTAEASRQHKELRLLRRLDEHVRAGPLRDSIIATLDDFTIDGPNGTHLCYVSQLGGPSVSAVSDSPGEMAGTRRLRAPLARKLARQLAKAVSFIHDVGIVHGDITPKNVLLQLRGIDRWSTETIYQQVGRPIRVEVFTSSGQKPDLSAPEYLVESASFSCVDFEYISEQALLIDLGEAFPELSPPSNGMVWILGMPPEPSNSLWEKNGITIAHHAQLDESTLNDRIRGIGMYDQEASMHDGNVVSENQHTLLEPSGRRISSDEESDLADLLRQTLDYTPEKRLSAEKVADHSWFANSE